MLVPIEPAFSDEQPRLAHQRPDVAFIAQLLATRAHDAQTRRIRRASAADAISAYAVNNMSGAGRTLSRLI